MGMDVEGSGRDLVLRFYLLPGGTEENINLSEKS
jgi:hypothetical protein